MISSRRITARPSASSGISTSLGITLGTCTMAKSRVSSSPPFFFTRAAMFKVLLRTRGKGREESTAMGVRTG